MPVRVKQAVNNVVASTEWISVDRCGAKWNKKGRCGADMGQEAHAPFRMAENSNSEPFFNSSYRHGVDDKRRIQIPAKWRNGPGEVEFMLILWPNNGQPDVCLLVLPPKVARTLVDKLTAMPFGDPKAEALRRFLGEKSDTVTCDKAGRITLPEPMARAIGVEKEAVLTGMFDRFQIWSPARYEATRPAVDALAPEAFKLI